MAPTCSAQWLDTAEMADRLSIHPKTLLRLRAAEFSPFKEGSHYRRGGLTTRAPFQWQSELCEEAFTEFSRVDPTRVEAFSGPELQILSQQSVEGREVSGDDTLEGGGGLKAVGASEAEVPNGRSYHSSLDHQFWE